MDRRSLDNEFRQFMAESTRDRADLRRLLEENTAITQQVADVLASFRVVAAVAKWLAAIAAGIAAIRHLPDWLSRQ